jgi:hypothetical protein
MSVRLALVTFLTVWTFCLPDAVSSFALEPVDPWPRPPTGSYSGPFIQPPHNERGQDIDFGDLRCRVYYQDTGNWLGYQICMHNFDKD